MATNRRTTRDIWEIPGSTFQFRAFGSRSSPHFSYHCGMMAKGIVVPQGTNGVRRRGETRVYSQGAKNPWRGKDRASTREGMRNAG